VVCVNDAQIPGLSRIGHDQGEAAVRVAYSNMAEARSVTRAGDAHPVPLQVPGKVTQSMALAALQEAAVLFERQ
jgi:hypothetical protein